MLTLWSTTPELISMQPSSLTPIPLLTAGGHAVNARAKSTQHGVAGPVPTAAIRIPPTVALCFKRHRCFDRSDARFNIEDVQLIPSTCVGKYMHH